MQNSISSVHYTMEASHSRSHRNQGTERRSLYIGADTRYLHPFTCRYGRYTALGITTTVSLVISACVCPPTQMSIIQRMPPIRLTVARKTQLENGNTRRRFHGTTRACCLGDTSTDYTFCEKPSCSLCNILQVISSSGFLGTNDSDVKYSIVVLWPGEFWSKDELWSFRNRYLYFRNVL